MTDETKRVEPDPLLMCFASALALEPVPPIILKADLEEVGFFEPGKVTTDELARALMQTGKGIDKNLACLESGGFFEPGVPVPAAIRAVEQDPIPDPTDTWPEQLQRAYDSYLAILRNPMAETTFWRLGLKEQGLAAPNASDFERQLTTSFATQRITELTFDWPRDLLAPAAETRRTLISLQPKPAHRPTSSMNKKRFKTASVAAAKFSNQQIGPGPAREWVATSLNRAELRLGKGALFKPRTIENWSTKMAYEPNLLKGMEIFAASVASALSEDVPTEYAAKAAMWTAFTTEYVARAAMRTAITFGKLDQTNSRKKLLKGDC